MTLDISRGSIIPDALRNFDVLPDSAHVRQPVVEALFSCSSATVWRWVKEGRIPEPYKLSDHLTAWNVGELRGVIQNQHLFANATHANDASKGKD